MKKPIFTWNPDTGESLCVIKDRDKVYYGIASCAPEDLDMMNEKAGCFIAEKRAKIMMLRSKRDELKIELKALKKYYSSMNTSKYFDDTSYPIRRLISHMSRLSEDLEDIKNLLDYEQEILNKYIQEKEKFYQKIRKNRNKKS